MLSEAIRDSGEYARHEARHAKNTTYSYPSGQRNFAEWLEENGTAGPPIQEITANHVRRFSYALSGRNLRPRTLRGAPHALRTTVQLPRPAGRSRPHPAHETCSLIS